MKLTKLNAALGVRIDGIDLSRPLDADAQRTIKQAFRDHVVMVFHGQSLPPAAQAEFTELFGAVEPHPLRTRRTVPGHDAVLILENQPGKPGARNDYWHSDISHAERPPLGTVLHSLEVPEGRGDTLFCNMYEAFAGLTPGLQDTLRGMAAVHSAEATARRNNLERNDGLPINDIPPERGHPVVRTHPDTGREALYVNPHFTTRFAGMTADESRPLLDYLHRQSVRPENIYRHRWAAGDLLMWDNRCTMHYAVKDYDETMPRLMHRTTAAGDVPR